MKDASRLSVCSLLCVPLYENLPSLDHSWLTPDESGHLLLDWLDESILPVNHIPVNHMVDKHKEGGPERKGVFFLVVDYQKYSLLHLSALLLSLCIREIIPTAALSRC